MVFTSGSVCSAINCTNNRKKTPHLSFFRFPKDPERSRKWAVNCGREDLLRKDVNYLYNNIKFCSLHFEPNQFMNELKKQLVWNAVPTLFDKTNKAPQVAISRKQLSIRHRISKPKKLFRATTVFDTVECKMEQCEDNAGCDTVGEPQMFQLKVEPQEGNTLSSFVLVPQVFPLKVELYEGNTDSSVANVPQMFEAVEMKMEPPEDDAGSDAVNGPQNFEFLPVKMEPCKWRPKDNNWDTCKLQTPALAAEGVGSKKTGDEATPRLSPAPPAVTDRKRKTTIRGPARKVILNVARCCELEKEQKRLLFPLSDPQARAAVYAGRSIAGLLEALGPQPGGPRPTKRRKTCNGKMENLDERVVRKTVEEFYTVQKVVPSLGKLMSALREKTQREWDRVALRKTLKALGFVWRRVAEGDRRTFLLERASRVRWRSRFIVQVKYMREVGREIFYLDESWIDTNLECGKYRDGEDASGSRLSAGAAARLVVRSVASRKGIGEEVPLAFCGSSTRGRRGTADFEEWFETSVLRNLPPESAVVMEDTPQHSRRADPAPSAYDPRAHMVAWLRRKGVACDDSMMKYVLWELIRANGGSQKDYVVDHMASVRGHAVIRLPPNVPDLSATDLAWEKVLKYVREHAVPGLSLANLQKVVAAAFKSLTTEDWEGYCERVRSLEEECWKCDRILEDAVDDVITGLGSPDSSDESEDSITEDSETESD